jgi:hypothetical protein
VSTIELKLQVSLRIRRRSVHKNANSARQRDGTAND